MKQSRFLIFATNLLINFVIADEVPANIIAALHRNVTAQNATDMSATSLGTYSLINEYNGTNFFSEFDFFTVERPS